MSFIRVTLPLSQLELDQDNPRYMPVTTQDAALNQMILSDPEGSYNLAKDIVMRGLNPSELLIIFQGNDGRNIVKDGNRRVSAINTILRPNRLPETESTLIRRFAALRQEAALKDPRLMGLKRLLCSVFDDEDEADYWVNLRHTGENNGVGTVKWTSLQSKRFTAHQSGIVPYDLEAYNLVESVANPELKNAMGLKFPITNLSRLLEDPAFRRDMGFAVVEGKLRYAKPEEEAMRNLVQVVKDIATRRKKVPDFFDNDKRATYADELRGMGYLRTIDELPTPIPVPTVQVVEQDDAPVTITPRRRAIARRPPSERSQLIPANFVVSISNDRANEIYHDLKNINVNKYPNAVSMEFRVFLEFSINEYVRGKNIDGISADTNLVTRIKRVADHFARESIMTNSELTGIRALCNEDGSRPITLVTELNQYIHNSDFNPNAPALKASWMNIQKFIEKLWDNPAG